MKVRKTINVDKDVWWAVKLEAMKRHVAVNQFVEDAIMAFLNILPGAKPEYIPNEEIEKDHRVLKTEKETYIQPKTETGRIREKTKPNVVVDSEAAELLAANERLKKKRELKEKFETTKGPVKVNKAMGGFFNPTPKDKDKKK